MTVLTRARKRGIRGSHVDPSLTRRVMNSRTGQSPSPYGNWNKTKGAMHTGFAASVRLPTSEKSGCRVWKAAIERECHFVSPKENRNDTKPTHAKFRVIRVFR